MPLGRADGGSQPSTLQQQQQRTGGAGIVDVHCRGACEHQHTSLPSDDAWQKPTCPWSKQAGTTTAPSTHATHCTPQPDPAYPPDAEEPRVPLVLPQRVTRICCRRPQVFSHAPRVPLGRQRQHQRRVAVQAAAAQRAQHLLAHSGPEASGGLRRGGRLAGLLCWLWAFALLPAPVATPCARCNTCSAMQLHAAGWLWNNAMLLHTP